MNNCVHGVSLNTFCDQCPVSAKDIVACLNDACVGHPHAKIAWPHNLLHDAATEITRLREQLAEAERQRDAEYERAESQAALVNCACCYDEPTDLCEAHKRVLDRLVADQRDAAQAEALEKAAKVCDEVAGNTKDFDRDHRRAAGQCGAAIRSLIKEDRT